MNSLALFAEHFSGEAQSAQPPVDEAKNIEENAVVAMKIYGNNRYIKLLDKANDCRLPFAVLNVQGLRDFGNCTGREKAHWLTAAHLSNSLADALHGDKFLFGVVAAKRVNRNEIRAHGRNVIQKHVNHDSEFGIVRSNNLDEQNTIESAERVVRYGDERPIRQRVENFLVVDSYGYV